MQQCPNCQFNNRLGVVFCENCGASLIGVSPIGTRSLGGDEALPGAVQAFTPAPTENVLTANTLLRLEISGFTEPVLLKPTQEIILGRRDPATGAMPDVDLTPFAGYRMGVSRRHAALRPGEDSGLDLWDLGSGNGTFLNGTRLGAHRPYRLHDNDELRLGQMVMKLYFQVSPAKTDSKPFSGSLSPDKAKDSKPNP